MVLTKFGKKLEEKFEKEYGHRRGKSIFYAYEHKHPNLMKHSTKSKFITSKTASLVLTGNKPYARRMYKHLLREHPSTKGRLKLYYGKN